MGFLPVALQPLLPCVYEFLLSKFPNEGCGLIVSSSQDNTLRVVTCQNIAPISQKHRLFQIDPKDLLNVLLSEESVRVIFHSHLNSGTPFSAQDQHLATVQSGLRRSPWFPKAYHLVISILTNSSMNPRIAGAVLYRWSHGSEKFEKWADL